MLFNLLCRRLTRGFLSSLFSASNSVVPTHMLTDSKKKAAYCAVVLDPQTQYTVVLDPQTQYTCTHSTALFYAFMQQLLCLKHFFTVCKLLGNMFNRWHLQSVTLTFHFILHSNSSFHCTVCMCMYYLQPFHVKCGTQVVLW